MIFAFWNIPGARLLINPLKLFTIGWHELCHAMMAILTGGTIISMTIDPTKGGCTVVEGGHPPSILAAGYIGSTLMGALFVLGGFDTLVAKILSFIAGVGIAAPLVQVRDKLYVQPLYPAFVPSFDLKSCAADWILVHRSWPGAEMVHPVSGHHAASVIFHSLPTMILELIQLRARFSSSSIFYVVWDIADDKYFRKPNDSDATQFSLLFSSIPPHGWAIIWILFEVAMLIAFVLIGIVSFKRTQEEMYAEAARFLPT
ncbi:hypothetical protein EW146_g9445 [Bondarzewia mesenterica]|uniref:Uncharacterized protein n=1 Tax=Bondarzewia mesenterica TaxID=1095465 RepID=A0A4S4LBH2_9AGAM|nr:hypothetical protein EW146_g9445 [Bondarzewia mesenterica]